MFAIHLSDAHASDQSIRSHPKIDTTKGGGDMSTRSALPAVTLSACLVVLSVVACFDNAAAPHEAAGPNFNASLATEPVDVPAVRVDLPSTSRPWDTDSAALAAAIDAQDGYAVIAFKAAANTRTFASGGLRSAIPAADVRSGLALVAARGGQVSFLYRTIGAALVHIAGGTAAALRKSPLVDWIEPRQTVSVPVQSASSLSPVSRRAFLAPGEVMSQTIPWGISMVNAPQAWSVTTGTQGKIGTDGDIVEQHQDLPTIPCANYGGRFAYDCQTFFGTHPGGTLDAGVWYARNNTIGVVGVAPGAPGGNVYVWAACEPGYTCYSSDIASGLDGLRFAQVQVIHIGTAGAYDLSVANAVAQAWAANIVIVAPVGDNTSNTPMYPAWNSNVIGVSGVDSIGNFATTSPCLNWSNYGDSVDIAAPYWGRTTTNYAGYITACGSGVAAAHVAGVAALVRSLHPDWSNAQVRDVLYSTARGLGSGGRDAHLGHGIVDAVAAVNWPPPPPVISVNISGPSPVQPYSSCWYTAYASGGTLPYSYAWTQDGVPVGDDNAMYQAYAGASSFILFVTVTDSNGLQGTNELSVTVDSGAQQCLANRPVRR